MPDSRMEVLISNEVGYTTIDVIDRGEGASYNLFILQAPEGVAGATLLRKEAEALKQALTEALG